MLKDHIDNSERLFRAIKLNPNLWNFEFKRPSSAAFKDSKGVSVDRQGTRTSNQVIDILRKRFEVRAIVSLTAIQCRDFDTYPISKKEPDNPEHAEIHRSPTEITLTNGQARNLSKNAKIDLNILL